MGAHESQPRSQRSDYWAHFPWWLIAVLLLLVLLLYLVVADPDYGEAFQVIADGLSLTLNITVASAIPALLIGFLVGRGCRSERALVRNLALFYLAVVGGIPTIIMIFFVFAVLVPSLGNWIGVETRSMPVVVTGVVALSLVYSAILGDLFRLALPETPSDQVRSRFGGLGVKPLVATGLALIALLKDSSLLSLLGVREITQLTRLQAGSTFQFEEAYVSAIFLYLVLTVVLRSLLQFIERSMVSVQQ